MWIMVDHPFGLECRPIMIADPATQVTFNYQIVNASHGKSQSDIEKQLIAAGVLVTKFFGAGTPWALIAGAVIGFFTLLIDADCDRMVAADQIGVTGSTLRGRTSGVGRRIETRYYPGTGSPRGCGSNSEYTVTWSLVGAGVVPQAVLDVRGVAVATR
jgi:hypothetical protein